MKKTILSAAVAGLMAVAGTASAGPVSFTFDPDGLGPAAASADNALLDWSPGNTLAVGGAGGVLLPLGTQVTDYFQANLSVVKDGNGLISFANGTGGQYFTLVAGFGEAVNGAAMVGPNGTNSFVYDPTANPAGGSYFKVFVNNVVGNDLTGANFTNGQLVLGGVITGLTANVTATGNVQGLPPIQTLDQFGADNWAGTQSILTNGAANVTAQLTFVDTDYFGGLVSGNQFAIALSNTSLITPYNQANPSRCLSNGAADCAIASNIGPINGVSGPNFLFQSDANSSFVPEPGSMALLGAAFLGFALSRKRKF